MPDARHANLLEPEALVELFLRHPPQGFAAASEADLPVFGTDFDLLTTLEPAILVKIRRLPLFGLWSRLLRFPGYGFGCYAAHGEEIINAIRWAVQDGYRYIDSAAMYGNEAEVGEAIRTCGVQREDLFISSKIWPTRFDDPRGAPAV